jgi:hypothetical protein
MVIDAPREQIGQQSLSREPELGDDLLGLADLLVQRVEDLRNTTLLGARRKRYLKIG